MQHQDTIRSPIERATEKLRDLYRCLDDPDRQREECDWACRLYCRIAGLDGEPAAERWLAHYLTKLEREII